MKSHSRVRFFVTPWAEAHQAPLSTGFSRQECWSELPFPSPGDLPDPEGSQPFCVKGRSTQPILKWEERLSFPTHLVTGRKKDKGWIGFVGSEFSPDAQSCPTLWDPMNCSTPGLPVHHQLPEFTQTHVRVRKPIKLSSGDFHFLYKYEVKCLSRMRMFGRRWWLWGFE